MSVSAGDLPSLVPAGITDVYPHALSFLPFDETAAFCAVSKEWRDAGNLAIPKDVKQFIKERNQLLSLINKNLCAGTSKKQNGGDDTDEKLADGDISEAISKMIIREMKAELEGIGVSTDKMLEKSDLISALKEHGRDHRKKKADEDDTNTSLVEANIKLIKASCAKLTRLFLDAENCLVTHAIKLNTDQTNHCVQRTGYSRIAQDATNGRSEEQTGMGGSGSCVWWLQPGWFGHGHSSGRTGGARADRCGLQPQRQIALPLTPYRGLAQW